MCLKRGCETGSELTPIPATLHMSLPASLDLIWCDFSILPLSNSLKAPEELFRRKHKSGLQGFGDIVWNAGTE